MYPKTSKIQLSVKTEHGSQCLSVKVSLLLYFASDRGILASFSLLTFPSLFLESPKACREPPNIPNAVIIHKHQEVFDMGSEVEYQCRHGYVTQDKNTKKFISCNNGTWTEGQLCSK